MVVGLGGEKAWRRGGGGGGCGCRGGGCDGDGCTSSTRAIARVADLAASVVVVVAVAAADMAAVGPLHSRFRQTYIPGSQGMTLSPYPSFVKTWMD